MASPWNHTCLSFGTSHFFFKSGNLSKVVALKQASTLEGPISKLTFVHVQEKVKLLVCLFETMKFQNSLSHFVWRQTYSVILSQLDSVTIHIQPEILSFFELPSFSSSKECGENMLLLSWESIEWKIYITM